MTDPRRPSDELRQEIAKVDLEIFALLDRRARISRRLGDLHRGNPLQLPLADHASIRALASRASDMPEEALLRIYREIFGACLALELPVEIAYAGVEGGPCHHAAGGRFGRTSKLRGVASASAAFDEVSKRRAEFAVVPFETSGGVGRAAAEATDMPSEGPVQAALMALLASDLRIAEMLDSTFDLHLVRRSADAAGDDGQIGGQ